MSGLKSVFMPYWSGNPYHKQLVEHLDKLGVQVEEAGFKNIFLPTAIAQWKPDILHLHTPDQFVLAPKSMLKALLNVVIFLNELIILRLMGVKIVWTVHDINNLEKRYPTLSRICNTFMARLADGIFTHSETAQQAVAKTFHLANPDKVFVVPHGNYINCYENKIYREEARKALNIPDSCFVMLFFGRIWPYKGVTELIDAFKQLHNNDVQLLIAGKPLNDEYAQLIRQKTASHDNIKFIPGHIPDDQIQVYMNACDVVVLPYRDIFTSGSVFLAMSFGRACIAPRKGCIGEVLDDSGAFLYDSDECLLQVMHHAIEKKADLPRMGKHNLQLADQLFSWSNLAKMTLDVYQQCLSR